MEVTEQTLRRIVSKSYTRYAGDDEKCVYLDLTITGSSFLLCLSNGYTVKLHHLTSDRPYMKWLNLNANKLLSLKKEQWYTTNRFSNGDIYGYYDEFHEILNRIGRDYH